MSKINRAATVREWCCLVWWMLAASGPAAAQSPSVIDQLIQESGLMVSAGPSPGSLYSPFGRLADLSRDLRAFQVDDLVTIVVSDRASAVARGSTNSKRSASAGGGIGALVGQSHGALTNLAKLQGEQQLEGQGETSRTSTLSTTLSGRVTHVLANGNLVVKGTKDVIINSERQQVTIRGVMRWNDVGAGNLVRSDRLSNLEVRVNGKGVVDDAIRRPNFVYRLLVGLLPF